MSNAEIAEYAKFFFILDFRRTKTSGNLIITLSLFSEKRNIHSIGKIIPIKNFENNKIPKI